MVAEGSWPRGTNSLVYEIGKRVWYIAPDHPDFQRLTARFGPENPEAERRWKQELDQQDRAQRALYRHRIVDPQDRLFLPGLVGHTEEAREIGALWDRSAKTWYVSVHHKDATALAQKYASPKGARKAAKYRAARAAAGLDKTRGAAGAPPGRSRAAASVAKGPRTGMHEVATGNGAGPGVKASRKRRPVPSTSRRSRDTGRER